MDQSMPTRKADVNDSNNTSVTSSTESALEEKRNQYDTPPEHINDAASDPNAALSPVGLRRQGQSLLPPLYSAQTNTEHNTAYPHHTSGKLTLPPVQSILGDIPESTVPNVSKMRGYGMPSPDFPGPLKIPCSYGSQDYIHQLRGDPHGWINETPTITHDDDTKSPRTQNPYLRRADEIGPTHGIPGLGHLENALEPPGWREGDAPIDPRLARKLFESSRKDAKEALQKNVTELERLSPEVREMREQANNREWTLRFKTDELVLQERTAIYQHYANFTRTRLGPVDADPRATTHYDFGTANQKTNGCQLQLQLDGQLSYPVFSNGATNTKGSIEAPVAGQGSGPPLQYPDASTLHPSLLNESLRAAVIRHEVQKNQMHESTAQLNAFVAQYTPAFTGPISTGFGSPMIGNLTVPYPCVYDGYQPRPAFSQGSGPPKPMPYFSPTRARFDASQGFHPNNGPLQYRYHDGTSFVNNAMNNSIHGRIDDTDVMRSTEQSGPAEKASVDNPGKKANAQRASKVQKAAPKEKKQPWYQEQLESSNPPTSEITSEALAKGATWRKATDTDIKKDIALPRKRIRRGAKPPYDPKKGIVLSDQAAYALVKGGYAPENLKKGQKSILETYQPKDSSKNMSISAPVGNMTGNGLNVSATSAYPIPGPANFVYSTQLAASSSATQNDLSDGSEESDISEDDPKDESFKTRASGRKVKASTPSKRRKSAGQ
ncbi:MAG: hypothetical protein M1827_007421 [Pycnora praestabilis]|nr:MAG: hypothetical protein M1827_007421 [Pycnora praestabilis]